MAEGVKSARFTAVLMDGHKGAAFEIPFDPAERWGEEAQQLWKGRCGHPVCGTLNGHAFEGVAVPRMKRFFVMVDAPTLERMKIAVGEEVAVTLERGR
jgi:uncharacterized protein DUF1905